MAVVLSVVDIVDCSLFVLQRASDVINIKGMTKNTALVFSSPAIVNCERELSKMMGEGNTTLLVERPRVLMKSIEAFTVSENVKAVTKNTCVKLQRFMHQL